MIGTDEVDHTIPVAQQQIRQPGALPPVSASPVPSAGGAASGTNSWMGNTSITSGLVAGAIGGLAGGILAEVIGFTDWNAETEGGTKVLAGLWIGFVGACIGFFLTAWEGFQAGSSQRAWRNGVVGLAIGAGAGFMAGWLGWHFLIQQLEDLGREFENNPFMTEGEAISKFNNTMRLVFAMLFGLLGVFVGGGIGLRQSSKKAVNGVIGGSIGGAIAGLIFYALWDPLSEILRGSEAPSDPTLELILAFTLTGLAVGLGIGLVDRLRRDAWLMLTAGPMAGKEFILYKPETVVGSDFQVDVVLVKDRAVTPRHFVLRRDGSGTVLAVTPGAAVSVNGTPVTNHRLRPGDQISVGSSVINYLERAATA
ncbi:MAG: FHA domain-containing protein [Acidimicrobiales bacterium]